MDCGFTLVEIYLFICKRSGRLEALAGRPSNNFRPDFTDEEVLTVYLFALFKTRRTVREFYDYTAVHFSSWFPDLPSYQIKSRVERGNRPHSLTEPYVNVSAHTALITQPTAGIRPPNVGTARDPSLPCGEAT